MYPFCLVVGIGDLGRRTVAAVQRHFQQQRFAPGETLQFIVFDAESIGGAKPETPPTRVEWHRRFTEQAEVAYDRLRKAVLSCEGILAGAKESRTAHLRKKVFSCFVVGSLPDPLASGVLFDVASLLSSAAAPWSCFTTAVLNLEVFFSDLAQEKRDCACVYAALRELDTLMLPSSPPFGMDFGGRVPVAPRQRPFDLCYVTTGENHLGTLKTEDHMVTFLGRFLGHCLASPLGVRLEQLWDDAQVSTAVIPWSQIGRPAAYSGIGMADVRIPLPSLTKYCVVRYGKDLAEKYLLLAPPAGEGDTAAEQLMTAATLRREDLVNALLEGDAKERMKPRVQPLSPLDEGDIRGHLTRIGESIKSIPLEPIEAQVDRNYERLKKERARMLEYAAHQMIQMKPAGIQRATGMLRKMLDLLPAERAKCVKKLKEYPDICDAYDEALRGLFDALTAYADSPWICRKLFGKKKRKRIESLQKLVTSELDRKLNALLECWAMERGVKLYDQLKAQCEDLLSAIASLQDRLREVARKFAELPVPPAEEELFMDRLAVTPAEFEHIYEKVRLEAIGGEAAAKELATFLQTYNPLNAWRDADADGLFQVFLGYVEQYMTRLHKLDVLADLVTDKRLAVGQAPLAALLDQMMDRSSPLSLHSEEVMGGKGNVLGVDGVGTGGADRLPEKVDDDGQAIERVENGDRTALVLCRVQHGFPLFSLPHLPEYRKKAEMLSLEERAAYYVLAGPDALPEI